MTKAYMEITLNITPANREKAGEVYSRYKAPFLANISGAISVSASFGVPLIISTPPNAMAFGQGGLKFTDLFWPGLLLMILGCVLVSLTGRSVLRLVGIP